MSVARTVARRRPRIKHMFEVAPCSCRFRRWLPVDIEQQFESNKRSTTFGREDGGRVMGLVQQAVLDFDDEVQAPWRPRLVAVAAGEECSVDGMRTRPLRPSGRSSS